MMFDALLRYWHHRKVPLRRRGGGCSRGLSEPSSQAAGTSPCVASPSLCAAAPLRKGNCVVHDYRSSLSMSIKSEQEAAVGGRVAHRHSTRCPRLQIPKYAFKFIAPAQSHAFHVLETISVPNECGA